MAKHPWLTQREGVFYVRARYPRISSRSSANAKSPTRSRRRIAKGAPPVIATEAKRLRIGSTGPTAEPPPRCRPRREPSEPLPSRWHKSKRWCDDHFQRIVDQEFEHRMRIVQKGLCRPGRFRRRQIHRAPDSQWYHTFYEELSLDERLLCCVNERHKQLSGRSEALAARSVIAAAPKQLADDL